MVAAGLVLSTVREAPAAADRGEVVQPAPTPLARLERRDPVPSVLGVGDAD